MAIFGITDWRQGDDALKSRSLSKAFEFLTMLNDSLCVIVLSITTLFSDCKDGLRFLQA